MTHIPLVIGDKDALFYLRRTGEAFVTSPDPNRASRPGPLQNPARVSADTPAGSSAKNRFCDS